MTMPDATHTISQLKEQVKSFCHERDWDQFHTPKDLAIGISTEASELLELFRFKDDAIVDTKRRQIEHELADVLYFLLRFAQMNNIDLSTALEDKLKHNALNYPIKTSKGVNKKYTEL